MVRIDCLPSQGWFSHGGNLALRPCSVAASLPKIFNDRSSNFYPASAVHPRKQFSNVGTSRLGTRIPTFTRPQIAAVTPASTPS